jgi:hypothetical protein
MTHPVAAAAAWSMTLPEPAGELATAPGGCAVAGAGFVALVRATGELVWHAPTEAGLRRGLAVLPDGRVAGVEGDHVVVRRAGGEIAARWDGRGVTALAATPDGDLVHVRWSREHGAALVKVGADGVVRGSVPLAGRGFHPPLVTRDLYVVAEGSRVRALDHSGRTRWTATRDRLTPGEPPPPDTTGAVREPVVALGDGRFVVEFTEDIGSALHIVDPHTDAVGRLATNVAPRSPVISGSAGRIAALGPLDPPASHRVVSFSPGGEVHWTHRFPARPATLHASAGGQVVVVTTPDRDRRGRRDTVEESTVWCLASDGTPTWTWQPPGPLTGTPLVSGDVLYVPVAGRLFALSLQDSRR